MSFDDISEESDFIPLMTNEDEVALEKENLPDVLPILPLTNTVLFPGVVIPINAGRDKSIKLIKDANAVHIAGDQHLATVIHHGIDEYEDGPWAFVVPAIVNNYYSRWWWPENGEAGKKYHFSSKEILSIKEILKKICRIKKKVRYKK